MTFEQRLTELQSQIESSQGFLIKREMDALEISSGICEGNYKELDKLLTSVSNFDVAVRLMAQENRDKLKVVESELQRFLFNYLSGAFSLIDHTRKFMAGHPEEPYLAEYKKKVEIMFAKDGLHRFFQNLRNYLCHFSIVFFSHELHFGTQQNEKYTCYIGRNQLLRWDGWDKLSLEWIKAQPEKLPILETLQYHHRNIVDFYVWFFGELSKAHAAEIDSTNEIIKKFNVVLTGQDAEVII